MAFNCGPETLGADYGAMVVPAMNLFGTVVENWGGKKSAPTPPPAAAIPWLPIIGIGGGVLLLVAVLAIKR